jgi:hypothetical protein
MSSKLKLAKVTGDDLANEPVDSGHPLVEASNYRQVLGPTQASAGTVVPPISDAAQAILIMYGCCASWSINYWRVTRRKEPGQPPPGLILRPGQKYRIQTGVSANATFDEWQRVVKNFAENISG